MNGEDYALRQELRGHEEDVSSIEVRAVAASDLGVITGSRDKTVRLWVEKDGTFELDTTLVGHTSFVSTVTALPAGALPQLPGAEIVSGSRDLSVIVWDKVSGSPAARLSGHEYQVSCVAVGKHNEVISTSHDGTIRVYSGPTLADVTVLTGHEGPVQAVLVLPHGAFLTGGNDAKIKLWADGKCQQTFLGHTDTVRGLALLADYGVVSASHDMTLKVWDFQGSIVSDLIGHTAIVYSAATSPSGLVASASEDNTARVWSPDGSCLATIPHPGCVWDVAFLLDNDLITGCSDYVARIWSADSSRQAAAEVQEAFSAALAPKQPEAGGSTAAALPDGLKIEEASALLRPGSRDGEIKVVSEDGGGVAYSWNAAQGSWDKVGQVVGGRGDAGSLDIGGNTIDGQHYDHVISVEIDDRGAPLRLGVNRSDNPYTVADNFILTHDLPASYRDQIVQYIIQNTGVSPGPMNEAFNPDPFTGGNAYVPGNPSNMPQLGQASASSVTGGGVDPFTGSSSYRPGQAPSSSRASAHVPATTMLVFDNLPNTGAVGAKIRSLGQGLAAAADTRSMGLTEPEAAPGGTLDRLLSSASAAPSGAASPTEAELSLLGKLLRWPASALFPALDITRLLILHEPFAVRLAANAGPLELSTLGTLGAALAAACAEPQLPANQQTGLRLLCNAFRSPALQAWLTQQAGAILDGFSPALTAPQKAVRAAAAAFLLDLAILSHRAEIPGDVPAQALSAVSGLLTATPPEDEDTLYRGVVALGTFVQGKQEARQVALDLDFSALLQGLQSSKALAAAASEVSTLLG